MKNVCFVGCGAIAKQHAKMLHGQVGQYFYSRSENRAKKCNDEFNGSGIFSRYEDVISSNEIDAVLLCSPPQAHKEQIILALRAGKSVLVEKPMVNSSQELAEIIEVASQHPKQFLMVAENYHYKPSLKTLQTLIEEDVIGSVKKIHIKKMFTQSSDGWKSKYGALFEGGIHFVALCSSLVGRIKPESVKVEFPNAKQAAERTSHLYLTYATGLQAQIDYSWETKDYFKGVFQHSRIVGEKGEIVFESNGVYLRSPKGFSFCDLKNLSGRRAMMDDFLACLDDSTRTPDYNYQQAALDLDIVFQAYDKAGLKVIQD